MSSALGGVLARLRGGKPLDEAAVDEIDRVLQALEDEGWSGFIPADEAVKALAASAREGDGAKRKDAQQKRKIQRLADELANHIAANGSKKHEIKKLEDLLVWIHRTEQPVEQIRAVIERTIPRRLKKEEA